MLKSILDNTDFLTWLLIWTLTYVCYSGFIGNGVFIDDLHDDVIKWKHFPRYWPFVTGKFPSQRPATGNFDLFFDLRLKKNGCINTRDAGDLRRHHVHHDVIVMRVHL